MSRGRTSRRPSARGRPVTGRAIAGTAPRLGRGTVAVRDQPCVLRGESRVALRSTTRRLPSVRHAAQTVVHRSAVPPSASLLGPPCRGSASAPTLGPGAPQRAAGSGRGTRADEADDHDAAGADIPRTVPAITPSLLPSPAHAGPRVSIVIPAYNSVAFLSRTLKSVLGQRFADWELVIYDDGSSDGTVSYCEAIADDEPRVRVV